METIIKEEVFEKLENSSKTETVLPQELSYPLMEEFVSSGYFVKNTIMMDRFLDEDRTIDLEKLELVIILAIKYLEFFNKSKEPIYVFIGNMLQYFDIRGVTNFSIDRIIEESSFILGFCNAIAQENKLESEVIVQFRGRE